MKTYNKEEKSAYFKALRERWAANKAQADQDEDARAKWQAVQAEAPDAHISYYGFYFALRAMQAQGLDGLPYVDAKTFNGWRGSGFSVRKGEHSKIEGVTWIKARGKDRDGNSAEDPDAPVYPKSYALFHRTQVEAVQ